MTKRQSGSRRPDVPKLIKMETKIFDDMPSKPDSPKMPKYFPDLQGSNRGQTPGQFCPWEWIPTGIGAGIATILVVIFGLGLYFYRDRLTELNEVVTNEAAVIRDQIAHVAEEMKQKVHDYLTHRINEANESNVSESE